MKHYKYIFAISLIFFSGCSYLMDSVEGKIRKRASFSIEAATNNAGLLTVTWDKVPDAESFAGYEIYQTEDADNEFAGYEVIAAPYDILSNYVDPSLEFPETDSVTIPYNQISYNGKIYFYRLGIIKWTESNESDRVEKWTVANGLPYNWPPSSFAAWEYFYNNKTTLDEISGAVMIEF